MSICPLRGNTDAMKTMSSDSHKGSRFAEKGSWKQLQRRHRFWGRIHNNSRIDG